MFSDMTYPHLPYAITEAYCLIFAVTVWYRLNNSIGTEHEIRQLHNMIYSYLGMLSMDIIWALTEDGILNPPHMLSASVNAAADISVSCGCYFWYRFIEDRLHYSSKRKKMLDNLTKIPIFTVCVIDIISIFTGWLFYIDTKNHYIETSLFAFQSIVNYFHLLVPTIYSLHKADKVHSKQERSEYRTYALYMIAPLISGLLEDVFPRVPLLALNIFMMILILFLMIQNKQIYNDALTGLNNRRRLNLFMEECLSKATADKPVLLFMMDINSFKSINDIYGHIEGDCALKTFSDVLRNVASKYYAFIARYGGDEFCFVTEASAYLPEKIISDIQNSLKEAQAEKIGQPDTYVLSVSVGYAVCDTEESNVDSIFEKADNMLYENKKKWHVENK